ncbi:MAG: hypothetical protein IIC03_07585 [Proteobacteria bacterium]|nr:hypothetical protein [Pseudomonadota bacterium]
MSSDGDAGKSGGGAWSSLRRIFGGEKPGQGSGPEDQPTVAERTFSDRPAVADSTVAGEPAGAAPAGDDGDDSALILGPANWLVTEETAADEDAEAAGAAETAGAEAAGGDEDAAGGEADTGPEDAERLFPAAAESGDEAADGSGEAASQEAGQEAGQEVGDDAGDAGADQPAVFGGIVEDLGGGQWPEEFIPGPALDPDPDPASESGATPDARALEDTIRELIRAELEGEIGQRLSKNIRRMIRDEVANAMRRRD